MSLRAFLSACPAAGQGSNLLKTNGLLRHKAPRNDSHSHPKRVYNLNLVQPDVHKVRQHLKNVIATALCFTEYAQFNQCRRQAQEELWKSSNHPQEDYFRVEY
jgi:hypothetical protein